MARKASVTRLPTPRITGKTTVGEWQDAVHKMVIKDRIQRAYARHANEMVELRKFKRQHGYCGGSPSCMVFTGVDRLCDACAKNAKNPKYKRPQYEYGVIRAKERENEREAKKKSEKAEKKERKEQPAPKRHRKAA